MKLNEKDLQQRWQEFFYKNDAGVALRERWENRVKGLTIKLIDSTDSSETEILKAQLKYHRDVLGPELGTPR